MMKSRFLHGDRITCIRLACGTCAAVFGAAIAVGAASTGSNAQGTGRQTQAPSSSAPRDHEGIPALGSISFAWLAVGANWLEPPPGSGHGPIGRDPDFPVHNNNDGPGQVQPAYGNYKDPVLKPWVAAQIHESNLEVQEGRRGLPFSAQGRCWPGGVPAQLLYPAEPFYFIQTPKEVWMIWQRDHMVRRVYLTDKHSENVKPSWFGESIGHYENDGTLVVDTIGLSTHYSYVDTVRTPHSEKEHVVERYTIAADGRTLQAAVMVDDPEAFNEPLHMVQRWRKVPNPLHETACAENNADFFLKNLFPMPQAESADF